MSALRRQGRRAGAGVVAVQHRPRPDRAGLHVAYAVGRPVGSSVVRNRVRRRLRAALVELDRGGEAPVNGDVLIRARARAAGADYDQLRRDLRAALAGVTGERA